MSHTKGPWKHEPGFRTLQAADDLDVVHLMSEYRSFDEVQANIRLVRAAPEMFEALQFLIKQDNSIGNLSNIDRDMIQIVLSKVRGES